MTVTLAHVTFDCADAARLASFWSAALGRPIDEGASPFFATIGYPTDGVTPTWMFIQVDEPKSAKNRMHLDVHAADRETEVARLVGLGATRHGDHDEHGHRWTVMSDPEGNEFCVA